MVEGVEAFFLFTIPPAEARKLLQVSGRAGFREAAMAAVAESFGSI